MQTVDAMKQALSVIRSSQEYSMGLSSFVEVADDLEQAIKQEALQAMHDNAQELGLGYEPAHAQEPVKTGDTLFRQFMSEADKVGITHWPTPPAANKPWIGLTDEDVAVVLTGDSSLSTRLDELTPSWVDLVRAIEVKLKGKNT